MGYYDNIDLREELAKIVLPDTILVPEPFKESCKGIEYLMNATFISVYGQAQETLRAFSSNLYSHASRREFAEKNMGLVNPYLLCEKGLHGEYMPDEMLKMMAILGDLDKLAGRPVAVVEVETALNPYKAPEPESEIVPLTDPNYWAKRSKAELRDISYWQNKRAEVAKLYGEDKRLKVKAIGDAFLAEKYGTYVRQNCEPITHEKFPWEQDLVAEKYWELRKGEVIP